MVKVVSTYGPMLEQKGLLESVCTESDVLRINISHTTIEQGIHQYNLLRKFGKPIMIDTCGPEVRIRTKEKFLLKKGQHIKIGRPNSSAKICLDQDIYPHMKAGEMIYFDDGMVAVSLVSKSKGLMEFRTHEDVEIRDHMGVNMKGRSFNFPALRKFDISVLRSTAPTFVALSFTRTAADIKEARRHTDAKIIAKIENWDGVKNIGSIMDEADGVMIARGDLGVEVPAEEVPIIQKEIIELANNHAKPSIVATQVLYSMVEHPVPTRAEVSDIANAVLDGTDAILLSNETAVGKYPLQAVREVKKVGKRIASHVCTKIQGNLHIKSLDTASEILSNTIYSIASKREIDKIVVITRSGYNAHMLSRFKLPKPLLAITTEEKVALELNLLYNVTPVKWEALPKKNVVPRAALFCLEHGLIDETDTVVFTAAVRTQKKDIMNLIEVHDMKDMLQYLEF